MSPAMAALAITLPLGLLLLLVAGLSAAQEAGS
jgi:hypothetical protein